MLEISQGTAIAVELLTAFLWGSWWQVTKRWKDYPLAAFMIWLYIFSNLIIWGVAICFKGVFIPEGIIASLIQKPELALFVFLCGIPFGISIQVGLYIMEKIGIILSTSVSATVGIITGTMIPMLINGLPAKVTVSMLLVAATIFLLATFVCQYSSIVRDREKNGGKNGKTVLGANKKVYLLYVLNIFLGLGYSFGMSTGMRSVTNPEGLPPMLASGVLCLGALTGTLFISLIRLKCSGELGVFFHTPKQILKLAALAACCHYGGNVTQMIAAPVLSLSVAWPLSTTSNVWAYFWGIVYGEYKGCSKKTAILLGTGILLFIIGVLYLAWTLYR